MNEIFEDRLKYTAKDVFRFVVVIFIGMCGLLFSIDLIYGWMIKFEFMSLFGVVPGLFLGVTCMHLAIRSFYDFANDTISTFEIIDSIATWDCQHEPVSKGSVSMFNVVEFRIGVGVPSSLCEINTFSGETQSFVVGKSVELRVFIEKNFPDINLIWDDPA